MERVALIEKVTPIPGEGGKQSLMFQKDFQNKPFRSKANQQESSEKHSA
jgi:hypothetical protein